MISDDILYSIGKTSTNQLVKAVDAEKGVVYSCPKCSQAFILRKGTRRRPHFAHKALNPNCTPESALHYSFKTLLFSKIQSHIAQRLPLEMQWNCSTCGGVHTGNLLKKAVKVILEHRLEFCRPDIALLDGQNSTAAVVEVIVTHPPTQKVLNYYRENNIALVSFKLKSDTDINRLDMNTLNPDDIDICKNPKCSKCGNYMSKKYLFIVDKRCWNCRSLMKVAVLGGDMGYGGDFSPRDIDVATQHGVFMELNYSNVLQKEGSSSICGKCGVFFDDRYYFTNSLDLDLHRCERIDLGYYCPHCIAKESNLICVPKYRM